MAGNIDDAPALPVKLPSGNPRVEIRRRRSMQNQSCHISKRKPKSPVHCYFTFPGWAGGYGDVLELKAEPWHKDESKTALLARLSVLPKAEQQAEVWERIKAKRYDNLRHGVFVKSVGKWFQTDDASRTQYLALAVMPRLPEKLPWKTMDNSFVNMTKALLGDTGQC